MNQTNKGFYIFCVTLTVALIVGIWSLFSGSDVPDKAPGETPSGIATEAVPPAVEMLHKDTPKAPPVPTPMVHRLDDRLLRESLEQGAVPTQEAGERGSLEGALPTIDKMVFADSPYERLPDSPLYRFTDAMVWPVGEGTFHAKRDALAAQANHIQEAAIALSVAPRVETERLTGYQLVEVPKDTLFSKLGIVSGDVIRSINGATPDMEPMALMFVNMAVGKQGQSTIVVEHNGVERTILLKAVE